jgi:TolB-like protein
MIINRHLELASDRPKVLPGPSSVDPIELVRAALAATYKVEREIGHGGMGRVYLACDLRHRREVAIKVLHPEIASALGPDRFLREIALAASFVHPNILPLYDSGSADGVLYYVTPYIEGESLGARIAREGQLRIEDAIRITGDVAAALDYAHGRGVVHRDVKPENILLTSGRALLTDFGLALNVSDGNGKRKTLSGYVLGTPSYMSPEQSSPGGQLDGRADIYALACVVYEMLAGEPPFAGATDRAVLARHAVDPVPPLRTVRPGIPAELEAAVLKALAKIPADRPAQAGKFAASLVAGFAATEARRGRGLRVARYLPLLGLVPVAVLPFILEVRSSPARLAAAAPALRPHLAVGTFTNGTGDPTLDPLGGLVASWLTWGLAESGMVEVVDTSVLGERTPVARGRPTGTRPAASIHAQLLVSGSYYRSGAAVLVQATITDVRRGTVVFAADPILTDRENPGAALGRLREQLLRGITASR